MSTDDQRHALGARLRRLRTAAGMSAAELGRVAGRSGAYPTEIERGERRPSPGTVRAVVAVLAGSDEDRGNQLLEELLSSGQATGQLADERPERRNRRREMARADRSRSAAIARDDSRAALAATERTLAALGTCDATLEFDELLARVQGWNARYPSELAKLREQLDEPLAEPEIEPFS